MKSCADMLSYQKIEPRSKSVYFVFVLQFDYQAKDSNKVDTACRTVSLVLSELSQLMTGFTYCYENEMRHWCNKSPPTLTQLGPAFKRVHRLLQQFVHVS